MGLVSLRCFFIPKRKRNRPMKPVVERMVKSEESKAEAE